MLPLNLTLAKLEALNEWAEEKEQKCLKQLLADPALATHPAIVELQAVRETRRDVLERLARANVPRQWRLLAQVNRDGAATQYIYEDFNGIEINLLKHRHHA